MPSCDQPQLIYQSPKPINITGEQRLWELVVQRGTVKVPYPEVQVPVHTAEKTKPISLSTEPISPHQPYLRERPTSVSAQCMIHICPAVLYTTHTDKYSFTNTSKEEKRGKESFTRSSFPPPAPLSKWTCCILFCFFFVFFNQASTG